MISWYALTTLLRACRNISNASSARCAARMVVCSSSPSPERNRSTAVAAFFPDDSTVRMTLASTSWKPALPRGSPAGRMLSGWSGAEIGAIGPVMRLPQQIQGARDHVLDCGDCRHIRLVIPRRTHQIHHVLGRANPRERHVPFG